MPPSEKNVLDVCVVGVGAATSVGASASASAAAIRAGIAVFSEHSCVIDREGNPFVVAMAPYLNPDLPYAERFVQLALAAANEALLPLAKVSNAGKIPTYVGLPNTRPGLPVDLTTNLSKPLKEIQPGKNLLADIQFLPNGHSAGILAIEAACQKIQQGTAEFCLAGGVDSYLDPDTLEWVEDCDQLHKPINAWGFIPGEAAGFCLLCSSKSAGQYGLTVLGRVAAVASAFEENRIKTKTVCISKGLTEAVRKVLETLPPVRPIIDYIICDQNGEAYRADEYGFLLARTSEWFRSCSDFLAPADCWGDVGAASGPLFVMLATTAAAKKYAKGPYTLLWTSSESGERSALLLHASIERKEGKNARHHQS